MDTVNILPGGSIGRGFIPAEFVPKGKDEYHIRNEQASQPQGGWRKLLAHEMKVLRENGNTATSWDDVLVAGAFNVSLIRNCEFHGLVRIGIVSDITLEYEDLLVPAGITNSRIISCDIGDDCAIHDVRYLAHYIVGNRCILTSIDEMLTTDAATFGNGIIKEGQSEADRVWLDIANESGGRRVLAFEGMLAADAYIWAKYRDDEAMQHRLVEVTQRSVDCRRGCYGVVGEQSVISGARMMHNVKAGPHCRIKGADRLENVTIDSSEDEPTTVGAGADVADGIIGRGCSITGGSKASRFVMGDESHLKNGARMASTFLGDNSTIACCEVQSNLIFGAHEQHHNNSFLIASLVMGQSNIAAGATIGSNHNSRAADGEIRAGRGFWPGLCTSLKHPSRFASFALVAKGDYAHELNITLPFALVNNNAAKDLLEVMPAYWWLYNMYALVRNSAKSVQRDARKRKLQHIEFDFLAPDTAEEVIRGLRLLRIWAAKAHLRKHRTATKVSEADLVKLGREVFSSKDAMEGLEILGENMEKSKRRVVIVKAHEAYHAYERMLIHYAVKALMGHGSSFAGMNETMKDGQREWVNLGGQLVGAKDVEEMRIGIVAGRLAGWADIHARYDELWKSYPLEKQKHAWAVLCMLLGAQQPTKEQWLGAIDKAAEIQEEICERVLASRKKDFDDPFRMITCRNRQEMAAATGTIEGNSFIEQVRKETTEFRQAAQEAKRSA